MWIGVLQLASLIALAMVVWYAREASLSLARLLAFLDARDIDYRKDRTDDTRGRAARVQSTMTGSTASSTPSPIARGANCSPASRAARP